MDNTEVKGHEKTVPEGTESCVDFSLRPLLLMERFYSSSIDHQSQNILTLMRDNTWQ